MWSIGVIFYQMLYGKKVRVVFCVREITMGNNKGNNVFTDNIS